jgi:endoglucanase
MNRTDSKRVGPAFRRAPTRSLRRRGTAGKAVPASRPPVEILQLAGDLLRLPTAPYHEHAVRAYVEAYCRHLGLPVMRDGVGNVIVQYRRGCRGAPLVLVAHMDHPGFEALGGRRAEFLGGVPKEWFPGARVRFGDKSVRVRRVLPGWPKKKVVVLSAPVPRGAFGVWDVPAFRVRGERLTARGIDDVLSVAVMLATLSAAVRQRLRTNLWCVFTRAEEVGFHGAMEVIRSGRIPRAALVVSLEMSKMRPWAKQGHGPVIRVGDRLTIFDPAGVYYLEMAAKKSAIRVQRCLMDGGACEATAFIALGYRACGLCLPLGNYHNIGPQRRIAAEFVSVKDLTGLVSLVVAAARGWPGRATLLRELPALVRKIRAAAPRVLRG